MARKSYVQIKTEDGDYKLVPKDEVDKYRRRSAEIMPDIEPFKSPIDGTIISSRSKYRDHMKRHGVIDVGNEKLNPGVKKKPKEDDGIIRELHNLWENVSQEGPR